MLGLDVLPGSQSFHRRIFSSEEVAACTWSELGRAFRKTMGSCWISCTGCPQIKGGSGTEHSTLGGFWQQTNVWWRSGNRFHLQVGFRSMERREKPKEKEEEELNRNPVSVLQSWSHTEGVCVYSAQLCQQKVWKDGREIHVKQFIEHSIHFSPKWVSKKPQLLKSVSTMNCCFVQLLRRHPSASQKMP